MRRHGGAFYGDERRMISYLQTAVFLGAGLAVGFFATELDTLKRIAGKVAAWARALPTKPFLRIVTYVMYATAFGLMVYAMTGCQEPAMAANFPISADLYCGKRHIQATGFLSLTSSGVLYRSAVDDKARFVKFPCEVVYR